MKKKAILILGVLFILVSFFLLDQMKSKRNRQEITESPMVFDQEKWQEHNGHKYPYREKMYRDVLYNDTVRNLYLSDILKLLGDPDRMEEDFYYYTINHTGMGAWTLHSKTMVFKFRQDEKVEWIKIHE